MQATEARKYPPMSFGLRDEERSGWPLAIASIGNPVQTTAMTTNTAAAIRSLHALCGFSGFRAISSA
jgi:hypothetical protein